AILPGAQARHRRIVARKKEEAHHGRSHVGRCRVGGWKRQNPSVASAQKYKGEDLTRSRSDAGFKNVALSNSIGGCGTGHESPRISSKTDDEGSTPQMAT